MPRLNGGVPVFGKGGIYEIDRLSSSDVGLVVHHWNAIERYLKSGRTDSYFSPDGRLIGGLESFAGFIVGGIELETDTRIIAASAEGLGFVSRGT